MLQARTAQGARALWMRESAAFMKMGELSPLSLPLLQGPVLHWRNGQGRPPGYPADNPDETAVGALPRAVSRLTRSRISGSQERTLRKTRLFRHTPRLPDTSMFGASSLISDYRIQPAKVVKEAARRGMADTRCHRSEVGPAPVAQRRERLRSPAAHEICDRSSRRREGYSACQHVPVNGSRSFPAPSSRYSPVRVVDILFRTA